MNTKPFVALCIGLFVLLIAVLTGFKVPYSNSWAMGKNCSPEGIWANTQHSLFPLEFLKRQELAAEVEKEKLQTFSRQVMADLKFAQETFGAKLRNSAQQMAATGATSNEMIYKMIEIEKKGLESEISSLISVIQGIPQEIERISNCSVTIDKSIGDIISRKCGAAFYSEARKQGVSNEHIIDFLKVQRDPCI